MGVSALLVVFLISLYGTGISLAGSVTGRRQMVRNAEVSVVLNFLLITVASTALWIAFSRRDFSLLYVFEHSSRSLPGIYNITAFWVGQAGSLLFWTWLLSAFTLLTVRQSRFSAPDLNPWIIFVLMVNSSFFLLLLNFVSNPFSPFPGPVPIDGNGLNPLLQSPWMFIHPPMLFTGYAGLMITFAFAMASLLAGRKDPLWIKMSRSWTVASWFFLGAGILLGA